MRSSGRLKVIATAALFSTGGALIKSCSWSGWQVAGFRSGVAALTLWLLCPGARRGINRRAALVCVGYAATLITFVQATKLTTAGNAIFLQSTAPFYMLVLSPWLLKEPLRRRDLGFMAALACGAALLFAGANDPQASAPDPARGNLYALASGVGWAFTLIGLRWLGRAGEGESGLGAVVLGNLLAFLVCLPKALPLDGARAQDWMTILILGTVQIGLAYRLLTSGMREVRAIEAALLLLLEPVLNPVWAWLVHGESVSALSLAGGLFILAATGVHAWLSERRLRAPGAVPA